MKIIMEDIFFNRPLTLPFKRYVLTKLSVKDIEAKFNINNLNEIFWQSYAWINYKIMDLPRLWNNITWFQYCRWREMGSKLMLENISPKIISENIVQVVSPENTNNRLNLAFLNSDGIVSLYWHIPVSLASFNRYDSTLFGPLCHKLTCIREYIIKIFANASEIACLSKTGTLYIIDPIKRTIIDRINNNKIVKVCYGVSTRVIIYENGTFLIEGSCLNKQAIIDSKIKIKQWVQYHELELPLMITLNNTLFQGLSQKEWNVTDVYTNNYDIVVIIDDKLYRLIDSNLSLLDNNVRTVCAYIRSNIIYTTDKPGLTMLDYDNNKKVYASNYNIIYSVHSPSNEYAYIYTSMFQ